MKDLKVALFAFLFVLSGCGLNTHSQTPQDARFQTDHPNPTLPAQYLVFQSNSAVGIVGGIPDGGGENVPAWSYSGYPLPGQSWLSGYVPQIASAMRINSPGPLRYLTGLALDLEGPSRTDTVPPVIAAFESEKCKVATFDPFAVAIQCGKPANVSSIENLPIDSAWGESMVPQFVNSQAFAEKMASDYYAAFLGRSPSDSELNAASGEIETGTGPVLESVMAQILASDEYSQKHGGSNEGYVVALYADLLARNASDTEIQSWLQAMESDLDRNAVARNFLSSREYRIDAINAAYELYLGRPVDGTSLSQWLSQLENNNSFGMRDVIAAIFASQEYQQRQQARLSSLVGEQVQPGGAFSCSVTPQTITAAVNQTVSVVVNVTGAQGGFHILGSQMQYHGDPTAGPKFAPDAVPFIRSLDEASFGESSFYLTRAYSLNPSLLAQVQTKYAAQYPGSLTETLVLIDSSGAETWCSYNVQLTQ